MRRHKAWARAIAATLALVMGLTMSAAPAAAADTKPSVAKTSLSVAAMKAAEKAPRAALVQTADPTAPAESGSGFFGSTKGKVALALFVGGVAWTIYSVKDSRDPVRSPIR